MNIEDFREFCLALPGTSEKMPFGKMGHGAENILVFYVAGKTFCYVDIELFDSCMIKGDMDAVAELKGQYRAVADAHHFSSKAWMSVRFNEDMRDDEVLRLVRRSHDIVEHDALKPKNRRR